jgi:hypothetical protein
MSQHVRPPTLPRSAIGDQRHRVWRVRCRRSIRAVELPAAFGSGGADSASSLVACSGDDGAGVPRKVVIGVRVTARVTD